MSVNFVSYAFLFAGGGRGPPVAQLNPQTVLLCERLGVDDPLTMLQDGVASQDLTPMSLPSCVTPERPGDHSQVSFTDSLLDSSLEDMSRSVQLSLR